MSASRPLMRIGIIGAPNTGKERLANTLTEALRQRGVSARQTRPAPHRFPLGPDQTEPSTRALIARAIAAEAGAEIEATKLGPVRAVLTRGVTWTAIAHFLVAHHARTGGIPSHGLYERLVRLALAAPGFDYLLLTPYDGRDRAETTEPQAAYDLHVHRRLTLLLEHENIPFTTLPPGDDASRSAVERVLGLYRAPAL
ncbi:hypothetical protein [Streptomyces sp. GZWMJZ-114]|uniref:hypothetical protein n=1 Tax=Streptomyces sp. GZWMJZ-114 TaxID=2494734 RepID=UPI00101063C8|nr:hypothetical protein [Streptomyces sp. GZWMJZ-114]